MFNFGKIVKSAAVLFFIILFSFNNFIYANSGDVLEVSDNQEKIAETKTEDQSSETLDSSEETAQKTLEAEDEVLKENEALGVLQEEETGETEKVKDLEVENTENKALESGISKGAENISVRSAGNDEVQTSQDISGQISTRVFTEVQNDDGSEKKVYYTGESIAPYSEIRFGKEASQIQNLKFKITIKKENLLSRPDFSDMKGMDGKTINEDDKNYYAVYDYSSIIGGAIIGIPTTFVWNQNTTPDGFETKVKLEVLNKDDQIIKTSETTFTAKTKEIGIREIFHIVNYDYSDNIDGKYIYYQNFGGVGNITPTGDDAPYFDFYHGLSFYETNRDLKYGIYKNKKVKVKLEVTLPEGAKLEEGSSKLKDEVLNYDEQTRVSIYEGFLDTNNSFGWETKGIKVLFPGQNYDNIYEIKSKLTIFPGEENEEVYPEETIYFKLNKVTNKNYFNKEIKTEYDYYSDSSHFKIYSDKRQDYDLVFRNYLNNSNYGQIDNENVEKTYIENIIDEELDDRLYYKSVKFSGDYDENINFSLYGVRSDDTEVLLGKNIAKDTVFDINDTEDNYQKLKVVFDEPMILFKKTFNFDVIAKLKDNFKNSDDFKNLVQNYGESIKEENNFYTKGNINGYTLAGNTKNIINTNILNHIYFQKENRTLGLYDFGIDKFTTINKEKSTNYSVRFHKDVLGFYSIKTYEELKNLKFIYLLPEGLEISSFSHNYNDETKTVIENYKNTGKKAIIRNIPEIFGYNDIGYNIQASSLTKEGRNEIETYVVWDNPEGFVNFKNSGDKYQDVLDLDNDGNTTEYFLKGVNYLNFIPSREVILVKGVSGSSKNFSKNKSFLELGEELWYKITTYNNSIAELDSLDIIDALPYAGDKSIVSNNSGNYVDRGSTFEVKLSGNPELLAENVGILDKFDIKYSLDSKGDNINQTKNANFVNASEIDDFSKVKLIKLSLKSGKNIGIKETVNFYLKSIIPNNLKLFDKAVNSAALSLNGIDFSESNKVSANVVKYKVKGVVFLDKNKNNIKDTEEKNLSGYRVELFNSDGVTTGKTTTTGQDGIYEFNLNEKGNFFVKIYKKYEGELASEIYNGDELGNDFILDENDNNAFKTEIFNLNTDSVVEDNPYEKGSSLVGIKNLGVFKKSGKIKIILTDFEDETKKLENIVFEIKKGDEILDTIITNADGIAISKDLVFSDDYKIIQKNLETGYFDEKSEKNVDLDSELKILDLKNKKIKGNVKIEKIQKGNENKKLSGAVFVLEQNGKEKYEATTNENGIALFENVVYGKYLLKEKKAPKNYRLSDEMREFSITENAKTLDLGLFSNEIGGSAPAKNYEIKNDDKVSINNFGDNPEKKLPNLNSAPNKEKTDIPESPKKENPIKVEIITPIENTFKIIDKNLDNTDKISKKIEAPFSVKNIFKEEKIENKKEKNVFKENTKIKKLVKRLPKTGADTRVETSLPDKKVFRLAGSKDKNLNTWLQVLDKEDRNKDKYIVIPSKGLIMPVNTVGEETKEYDNFINGVSEDFANFLKDGSVELPGTTLNGYGKDGNKVIGGHSSYWKNAEGRYKTHFQKIIGLEKGKEIWIYEKNKKTGKFDRYIYKIIKSYNTNPDDVSILAPTKKSQLTLFTCTPIGGVEGRWIIKSDFIGKD